MDKKSEAELAQSLETAKTTITIGAQYGHYKHPEQPYVVKDIAIQEYSQEPVVIYQAQSGNHITFIRPVTEWLELVEFEGKQVPRFRAL